MAADIVSNIRTLLDAERTVRSIHQAMRAAPIDDVVAALREHVSKSAGLRGEELIAALTPVATLAGTLDSPKALSVLLPMLSSEEPVVRMTAGESFLAMLERDLTTLEPALRTWLEKLTPGDIALSESAYLLGELGAPECVPLLGVILRNKDPEAVAAAIEALVELGDRAALPLLKPLFKDGRLATIEGEDGGEERLSLGALAQEAAEIIEEA
jgi:HEAT repeat protein